MCCPFHNGEKITASDSETDKIVENSSNTDLTISEIVTHTFSDTRSLFMDDVDAGQDFTANAVLTPTTIQTEQIVMDGSDANDANDNIVLEEDNSTTIALEVEKVATLENTEKNISI